MSDNDFFEYSYNPGFFYNFKHKKKLNKIFTNNYLSPLINAKNNILDIGFYATNELIKISNTFRSSRIIGIDVFKKRMKTLSHSIKDINNIHVVYGDINNLDFEHNYFDIISSINSFYFAQEANTVLNKISSFIKKKGILILTLDIFDDISSDNKLIYDKNNISYKIFKTEEILKLLKENKFKNIKTETINNNLVLYCEKR